MEPIQIMVLSIIVFAISLLIVLQQFLYLYKMCRLEPTDHNEKYSENKLDIAFVIMVVSMFMFINSIKNM